MKNKITKSVQCVTGSILLLVFSSVLAATDPQEQKYTLGQQALGGTIIYLNAAGTHGLVAANTDQGGDTLWNASNAVTIPNNYGSEAQVYTDWHLPSIHELTVMCNNMHLFPAGATPAGTSYWSSTIYGQHIIRDRVYTDAGIMDMKKCTKDTYDNTLNANIRAVRTF